MPLQFPAGPPALLPAPFLALSIIYTYVSSVFEFVGDGCWLTAVWSSSNCGVKRVLLWRRLQLHSWKTLQSISSIPSLCLCCLAGLVAVGARDDNFVAVFSEKINEWNVWYVVCSRSNSDVRKIEFIVTFWIVCLELLVVVHDLLFRVNAGLYLLFKPIICWPHGIASSSYSVFWHCRNSDCSSCWTALQSCWIFRSFDVNKENTAKSQSDVRLVAGLNLELVKEVLYRDYLHTNIFDVKSNVDWIEYYWAVVTGTTRLPSKTINQIRKLLLRTPRRPRFHLSRPSGWMQKGTPWSSPIHSYPSPSLLQYGMANKNKHDLSTMSR